MNSSFRYILAGFLVLFISATLVSASSGPEFKILPFSMKEPTSGSPYVDETFMTDAGAAIESISNTTVPTGSKQSDVSSTYYRLIMDNVSPEFFKTANDIIAYLYYASMAGEAYQDYHNYLNSASRDSDGSEYYAMVKQYYKLSANSWANISGKFPNMTITSLPDANAELPAETLDDSDNTDVTLKGLEIPISSAQKEYDPKSPDQTGKFKNVTIKWFRENVDHPFYPEESSDDISVNTVVNASTGHKFMTSDAMNWAESTYLDLTGLNVAKNFEDTADYVDAFFSYLAQSKSFYEDYMDGLNSFSSMDKGKSSYDKSLKYYNEAQKSVNYFKDIIPNGTNTTLPEFPKYGEAAINQFTYGALGYVDSDTAESLGYSSDSNSAYYTGE